jgi:hypothetical protein
MKKNTYEEHVKEFLKVPVNLKLKAPINLKFEFYVDK